MLWATFGVAAIFFGAFVLFIGVYLSMLGYSILGGVLVVYGIVVLVNLWRNHKRSANGIEITDGT